MEKENNIISNIIDNIISYHHCIIIFLIKLIMIINIFISIKGNKFDFYYFHYSKITLKVKGIGENNILGDNKDYNFSDIDYLKEVFINGHKQDKIDYKYYFNQTDNYVELIWNDSITNCDNMFFLCTSITEINLSNFNTSQIESMANIFNRCSSLTSLNLSNFDTSKVINMKGMFYNCWLLTSLDLSNFDTTLVSYMNHMFVNCSSLTSFNISNFNTSKVISMNSMFYNCSSLSSLNLSNFNISQVIYKHGMHHMFYSCSNLEYINLNKFDENK